jgi:hypothetical protein
VGRSYFWKRNETSDVGMQATLLIINCIVE